MKAQVTGSLSSLEGEHILSLCLRGKIWKYRGEGNANIVIALPQERQILRLHKWEREKEITPEIELEEERRVWREVVFCRTVMVPLLGSAYIQPPRPARLDNEVLVQLDVALKPLRPVYRTHKGIKFCYVTIYPDYALLPFGIKNATDNILCNLNNFRTIPLQSIENQNNCYSDDVSSRMLLSKGKPLCAHRRNETRYYIDFDLQLNSAQRRDEEDIVFIENNRNVNEVLDLPLLISNASERSRVGFSQYLSPLYISTNSRGPRRFSTGSDFNVILPSNTFSYDPYEISSSAPVYSECFFDSDISKEPVFCVEIKPKQGWIPLMDRINPKCTFCLNQYLKLSKGLIETISHYCPLDLFSGDETRMRKALRNLLTTPQNNLKLFRDGVLLYSDNMSNDELFPILKEWLTPWKQGLSDDDLERYKEKFCDLVLNALITDLTAGEPLPEIEDICNSECSNIKDNYKIVRDIWPSSPIIKSSTLLFDLSPSCDWTSQQLPPNCILDRILKIQQLEQSGADSVFNIHKELYPDDSDFDYVNTLCNHPENVLRLDPVQRYLLATTAKDCSILIAFQKVDRQSSCNTKRTHIMKDADGTSYAWNVGISDLDPKPLSCISKHRKRDADVIAAYIEYFKNM